VGKYCLEINPDKTKIMRINIKRKESLTFTGRTVNEVETLLCLGSVVTKEGGTEQDKKKSHQQGTPIIYSAISNVEI
jgi:hypothetical protein